MKALLQIAALLAATCLASVASAQPLANLPGVPGGHGPVKVLVIVSSHGLDLSTDAGADQFLGRLTDAVNRACNDRPVDGPALTIARTAKFQVCRAQALETALTYVHSPIVRRRYAAMAARDDLRLARR
ncbi:MAG: UrcA family protein [Caulobacterales bacterium]|jgi:UrcA family protein